MAANPETTSWGDMRVPIIRKQLRRRHAGTDESPRHSRGQSLVEFALALPVLLFMVLIGVDFGRGFAGWVTLQQAARTAANYASEHSSGWEGTGSPISQAAYQTLIASETQGINCTMPSPAPDPTFPSGTEIGMPAVAELSCTFTVLTPFVASALPNPFNFTALASFPIRDGRLTPQNPGGGSPSAHAVIATIPASPTGPSPLYIQFLDASQNSPTAWTWDFGDGSPVSNEQFPSHTYINGGATTLSHTVWLTACNPGGCGVASVVVNVQSATPTPTACFTPSSGTYTSPVTIAFNSGCTTANPTSWSWAFGDGGTSTSQNPSHLFSTAGTQSCAPAAGNTCWIITLTATNSYGSDTISHAIQMNAPALCGPVPNFVNDRIRTSDLQAPSGPIYVKWTSAGFTGAIIPNPSGTQSTGNPKVKTQSPNPGTYQVCSSPLTLNW